MNPEHSEKAGKPHQRILRLAKANRTRLTEAERKLWKYLRDRRLNGHKFRRQHTIHEYVVDFVCLEKKLVIELDGRHHALAKQSGSDESRTSVLNKRGFTVLRFWNRDIAARPESALPIILEALGDESEMHD